MFQAATVSPPVKWANLCFIGVALAVSLFLGGLTLGPVYALSPKTSNPQPAKATERLLAEETCFATPDDGATAYSSITAQAVRDAVAVATATVKIAGYCPGVVFQGDTTQTLLISSALTLAGGYTFTNWHNANPAVNPTTLDASNAGRVISSAAPRLILRDMIVINGNISGDGAGIYAQGALSLTGVTVISNTASGNGGGVYITSGAIDLASSVLAGNRASGNGGAMYLNSAGSSSRVVNTLFARNRGNGAALYVASTSELSILHSTVVSPSGVANAAIHVAGGVVYITNTLITSHTYGVRGAGGIIIANHTLFFGNTYNITGTVTNLNPVSGYPGFLNPRGGDFHIAGSSAARNRGLTPNPIVKVDAEGDARPAQEGYDIGYDEHAPVVFISSANWPTEVPLASPATFVARVFPATVGWPLTYTWQATNQISVTHINVLSVSDAVSFTWDVAGVKTITVTAANASGAFTTTAKVTVGATPAILLTKTVGTDPAACAPTNHLRVFTSTWVTYCYIVQNVGDIPLISHTLHDSHLGDILLAHPYALAPGATIFITQTASLVTPTTNTAVWVATSAFSSTTAATATATVNFTELTGVVFEDLNHNGYQEADELGMADIEVSILKNTTIAHTFSTSDGSYVFSGLEPGSYTVVVSLPSGYATSTLNPIQLVVNTPNVYSVNFGLYATTQHPAIVLSQTVGLAPEVCAATDSLYIFGPMAVTYCYTVQNTGDVTFTQHTINASPLGAVALNYPFTLTPGAITFLTHTVMVSNTITNTAIWTATDGMEVALATSAAQVFVAPALLLTKTVGLNPSECAVTNTLSVLGPTAVTYCYLVQNISNVTFVTHWLTDTQLGVIYAAQPLTLAPGAFASVTRTIVVSSSIVNTATWTGGNSPYLASASRTATVTVIPAAPRLILTTTVGLAPTECASTNQLNIMKPTTVTYCYIAQNMGNVTFTTHTLWDSQLGIVLATQALVLAPGESHLVTRTKIVSNSSTNTAVWIATNGSYISAPEATASVHLRFAQLTGMIFNDRNGNAIQDETEMGLAGVPITLTGAAQMSTTSASEGTYNFTSLGLGSYTVTIGLPSGFTATTPSHYSFIISTTNASYVASFGLAQLVVLSVTHNGGGTISSIPMGISCGMTCTVTFTQGTLLTLTATPNLGYTFIGWHGACSGAGLCVVALNEPQNMTATFMFNAHQQYLPFVVASPINNEFSANISNRLRLPCKRRDAIEPNISHPKMDYDLARNYLHGQLGNQLNAFLVGRSFNLAKRLRFFATTSSFPVTSYSIFLGRFAK